MNKKPVHQLQALKKKITVILISNLVILGIETGDIICNKYLHWPVENVSQHMLSYLFLK